MTRRQWEAFFSMLREIVDGEGTWEEKRAEVVAHAKVEGEEMALYEFSQWFYQEPLG